MKRIQGLLWAAAAMVFGGGACGGDQAQEQPPIILPIGLMIDQASASAYTSWPGSGNLAIKQINDGLAQARAPVRFRLLLNDTTQDARVASMQSLDMVRLQGAKAIITDTSKNGIAITKLMYDGDAGNDLDVPVVCVTCTAPALNDPAAKGTDEVDTATLRDAGNWSFRTCNRATEQTAVLERVILSRGTNGDADHNGTFKISVVVLDDNSGHGFVKSTQDLFSRANPGIRVEKIVLPSPDLRLTDGAYWDQVARKLTDADNDCPQDPADANHCLAPVAGDGPPDALMENLNPGINIALSLALERLGNQVTFFHAHAFRASQTAARLGSATNGQQGVSPALFDDSPSGQQFASDLQAATGKGPAVLDAEVYDAAAVVALAVLKATAGISQPADVTGAEVRDALQEVNVPGGEVVGVGAAEFAKAYRTITGGGPINYQGASGPVDFDPYGNVWVELALYEGVDGAFQDVQKFDCVHDHSCPAVP
jgi:hypothetical protein